MQRMRLNSLPKLAGVGLLLIFTARLHAESLTTQTIICNFSTPVVPIDGATYGPDGALTFELFRNGTFVIDGKLPCMQRSNSYLDSAIIRSTRPLPPRYKISVVAGDIQYDLANIAKLPRDPQYSEGPPNENGCYLLSITDALPNEHHTNDWWHQHRKVVIDVDNNIWGNGMPRPIFMVYFDTANKLRSWNGATRAWTSNWRKGVQYQPGKYYRVEIERTDEAFIFSVSSEAGALLQQASTPLSTVWHADGEKYPEYFVIGDPHENYYQGLFKIKSIAVSTPKGLD